MERDPTSTAYRDWDRLWLTERGRADWLTPEPAVVALATWVAARGGRRALDLGCGVGRHCVLLAQRGFAVAALDASASGLSHARQLAARHEVTVSFQQGAMTRLPYADATFDVVLAWNVVYHGDRSVVQRTLGEIHRVLRPGGWYQGTMLSKRNADYHHPAAREIAPDTLVGGDGADKQHPHYYCSAADLVALHAGFELLALHDREQHRPGSHHWELVAERLDGATG